MRKQIGSDMMAVQWRWPISKPLVDGFGGGLYEVRTSADGKEWRVLFCVAENTMIALHGFEKRTQKTPKKELEIARKRQKAVER